MIQLDLKTLLPTVRQALNAQTLQAQTQNRPNGRACAYQGPCAVGVGMTPEQRADMDQAFLDGRATATTIEALISAGLVEVPEDQVQHFADLQWVHDQWSDIPTDLNRVAFEATLERLEARYAA